MTSTSTWTAYTDGGARGNPGPAGAGAVLYDPTGREVAAISKFLGKTTNNVAEYTAVILVLEEALRHPVRRLNMRLDSELIVRQMNGMYRVRQPHLQVLYAKIQSLLARFEDVTFTHVRREQNKRADELANMAMDDGNKQS